MIQAHAVSDAGPVRKNNEDSCAIEDALQLYVVADGMGGHSAGEVASRLAVEAVVGFIRRSHEDSDISWPYGIDRGLSLDGNRMQTAIYLANRRVFRAAESHDDYTGMGTTIVCALITGRRLVIGHVGDSRLYLLNGSGLRQMTQDDTWAAAVLAHGHSTASASQHPMRHVLTNVLGAREQTEPHVTEHDLVGGETLLLCSDGLYGSVPDAAILDVLKRARAADEAAARLVQMALDAGTRDNVTALVVRYEVDT
ncbi:MAG TPA: protein phosphatase 2C domain-containing protein [Vicinamibacterales bacterium]|nr:protein phosphatase 2C domain-containing protein [Vicinamibacterales bacterium]